MRRSVFIILFAVCVIPVSGYGQFIQLFMEVEPEVEVRQVSTLRFGEIGAVDSVAVNFGDLRMGIMNIIGIRDQQVSVTVLSPEYLVLVGEDDCQTNDCRIETRLNLNFSYILNTIQELGMTVERLGNEQRYITSLSPPGGTSQEIVTLYMFVHGIAITRGARSGNYEGDLIISVDY